MASAAALGEVHLASASGSTPHLNLPPHDRGVVLARDVDGMPFAFVPLTCRLYSLPEVDAPEDGAVVVDVSSFPELYADLARHVATTDPARLHRHHTPGVALILAQTCNLTCNYCLAKRGTFGLPVEKASEARIRQQLEELFIQQPEISFIKFFGGEPTIRLDLIEKVCRFVRDDLGKRQVGFALTTNGTHNAKQHLPIWQEFHISVSVSIDGPEAIHDAVRKTANGKGSFSAALKYCEEMETASCAFFVVGVFDERHLNEGFSYLETIKFLNGISPLVKVQFAEALGDAIPTLSGTADHQNFDLDLARSMIDEAVDGVFSTFDRSWLSPSDPSWVYDNNIFRFISGVVSGQAIPYQHACTASQLTTLMPSGLKLPCYTFSERPDLYLGQPDDPLDHVESKRRHFRDKHSWDQLACSGSSVPWYRGIVGDICVADMMSNGGKHLQSSPLYQRFQERTSLRVLQNLAAVVRNPWRCARLQHALEQHRVLTGQW